MMQRPSSRALRQAFFTPLAGAIAIVVVLASALATGALLTAHHGATREYWIAAVPEQWNIVPTGKDELTGMTFAAKDTTFEALIYRGYSANWASPLPDPYGGMPGPALFGEVGDIIIVHFKNLDSYFHRPHSMHPHGVHYTPANDGAYVQTDEQPGSVVPEGGTYTYTWTVGEDSVGV